MYLPSRRARFGTEQMKDSSPGCEHLFMRYATLEQQPRVNLSIDDRRGMLFYSAELALTAGAEMPQDLPHRVIEWTTKRARLENFFLRFGRGPTRIASPSGSAAEEESKLAEWQHTQRQSRLAGRLCWYQLARLECIQGFFWDSLEERWRRMFNDYREFVIERGAAPSDASPNHRERALADWATRQRRHYWTGRMSEERTKELAALPIWTWGPRPMK